jgi:hypothetical protein
MPRFVPVNHSRVGVEPEDPAGSDPGVLELLWSDSRAGARAGRGFHYQDLVGAGVACRVLAGEWVLDRLVPQSPPVYWRLDPGFPTLMMVSRLIFWVPA